jgi:hypothetical protein
MRQHRACTSRAPVNCQTRPPDRRDQAAVCVLSYASQLSCAPLLTATREQAAVPQTPGARDNSLREGPHARLQLHPHPQNLPAAVSATHTQRHLVHGLPVSADASCRGVGCGTASGSC